MISEEPVVSLFSGENGLIISFLELDVDFQFFIMNPYVFSVILGKCVLDKHNTVLL